MGDDVRRNSTHRMQSIRAKVLDKVAKAWDKAPYLSFGELISRGVRHKNPDTLALLRLESFEDFELADAILDHALLSEAPTNPGKR